MKGLPSACCCCSKPLNNDSILLVCSCLVSICRSCCLEQMANKPSTYRSHITCPVCGDQQTNVVNGIIGGIKEAENDEEELISDACDYFGVPILRARKSLKTKLNMLRTLQENFVSLGYPWFIEPDESKPSEIVYRLGLYVSRCEARRQDPDEAAAGTLPLGPLECITFKPNYILHRILDMVAGREDAIAMQKYCNICRDILVPGNTVRRMCPCRAHACQHCVRRSLTSNNTYNQPARCFSCNLGTILVEDVQEARRAEQELLRDLPQYKSGAGIGRMYSLYTDLSQECGMIKTLDYDSFMGQDHTGKIYGRAMCTLELARLCQERRRRLLLNVPAGQASDVSELSLGPLAYLSIDCDVFLEAFLVFLDGPADPPDTTGQVLSDPHCCFDEATNRVRQTHQPGGELSREAAAEAEAERLRADAVEDQTELGRDLTLLLRSAHTPCPYEGCSVDPQCPVYLDEHIARHHIGSVVELATPVTTPASRRRSRRPSQAPLQEGAVVVIDDDSTVPGSEVAEWESCSVASNSAATASESIFSVVSDGDASEGALIAISSEDDEEGVEEDMVVEDSEDKVEDEQEEKGMVVEEEEGERDVPPHGMEVAAVPQVVAVDRPRPGLVFRALQPSQSANMSLPAQPHRRSTLPVAGTTTPSARRNSQSRWSAAAASLTLSVPTNTAARLPSLATTTAPVHRIKRKVDTFVEDEVEAPVQVQQFLYVQAPRSALPQPPAAPSARAFTGRTLADAMTSTGAPLVVDLTSVEKSARIAEINRKYQAQVEAEERLVAPRSSSSKVRFTAGHETRTFENQQQYEQEEDVECGADDEEDTQLLPAPTDYSLSDFTEPLQQLQSAPELDFFSMVNRARSSIHLGARPPTPPPSPPPPPPYPVTGPHEQLSVPFRSPLPVCHPPPLRPPFPPPPPHLRPPFPPSPPQLPSGNHWMPAEDGVHGMGQPSKRARLDASPPPYGTPYAEGQQRFLGKVMGTPEEAWPSDEAHRNLQDPRARRYELIFEQEAPLAAASSNVVEFRLKYPAGALKTSTEAVPSSEEGFFVVNIPIVHGVQSRLLAVLQLIVMQKYEFRGEISKWKLIKSNKIQNFLDATKTFLKYGIPAGSRIVLRELPPEVEPKPPALFKPSASRRGKKRMTNAQFAKESMLRKQQADEEALRVQTEGAVKAESGLGADLPVKGESRLGTVRPVQAEPEEGEVPDDAVEDVTLVDSGSSNHSGDRTLSDDGVSESSSAVRCAKPSVATSTDASASRKRSCWDAESAVDAKPTDSRHVVSPPGTEEDARRGNSSSNGMTAVDPSLLLAASLPATAAQAERNVRPKLTKEALSSLQSGFDAATHPPAPLSPLQSSQLPVSGVVPTAQQTAAPSAQPTKAPVKSRFGTDEDFQVDPEDWETPSDDSDADPNPTGKRKGGMRKDKLPLAQRRTGSTNATGITNGNHRPPIYFDRTVTFNTTAAAVDSHVGQSQSGMRPVSDLAALEQTGRTEQSSGRDRNTRDRRGHSNASSDDRHRYSSDQGDSRYEPRRDGRGRQRSPLRTAAGTDDMRPQYRDSSGRGRNSSGRDRGRSGRDRDSSDRGRDSSGRDRDSSGRDRDSSDRGRDSSGRDRDINRENYSRDRDRDRGSYGRGRDSVDWSIDRGSSAQSLVQPAPGRASAGQQLQGGSAATAIDLAAPPSEAALQEVLSWQAKPHR